MNTFLFLPQDREGFKVSESYVAVRIAQISDNIESNSKIVSNGVLFKSSLSWSEVNGELDGNYLLIEINKEKGCSPYFSVNEAIEDVTNKSMQDQLNEAVYHEDYKLASHLRDIINGTN